MNTTASDVEALLDRLTMIDNRDALRLEKSYEFGCARLYSLDPISADEAAFLRDALDAIFVERHQRRMRVAAACAPWFEVPQ